MEDRDGIIERYKGEINTRDDLIHSEKGICLGIIELGSA